MRLRHNLHHLITWFDANHAAFWCKKHLCCTLFCGLFSCFLCNYLIANVLQSCWIRCIFPIKLFWFSNTRVMRGHLLSKFMGNKKNAEKAFWGIKLLLCNEMADCLWQRKMLQMANYVLQIVSAIWKINPIFAIFINVKFA